MRVSKAVIREPRSRTMSIRLSSLRSSPRNLRSDAGEAVEYVVCPKDYLWRTQLEVVPWASFNCQVFNRYAPSLTDYLSERACLTYPSC
jgi:hypothetical protein